MTLNRELNTSEELKYKISKEIGKAFSVTTPKVNCASDTSSFETSLGIAEFDVL